MTENFVSTPSQEELLNALKCWKKIVPFLRKMYFIHKNDTKAKQDECEDNYKNY